MYKEPLSFLGKKAGKRVRVNFNYKDEIIKEAQIKLQAYQEALKIMENKKMNKGESVNKTPDNTLNNKRLASLSGINPYSLSSTQSLSHKGIWENGYEIGKQERDKEEMEFLEELLNRKAGLSAGVKLNLTIRLQALKQNGK